MIFVDSTVPMYLVGADHPHKVDARRLLEHFIGDGRALCTDAEVFQEILHRYGAIDRRDAIQPAFDALLGVVDTVFPIEFAATEKAKSILLGDKSLSARDAIHLAVMNQHMVSQILTFDAAFDRVPGIERLR